MGKDGKPRPSCNCKTSQCIQRYCQCFGNWWFCSDACRCESCYNTEAREAFVEERAELILKTKPKAFQPRGCTCRKSECKKNYCDCFKNRVACTGRCKCKGCTNTHGAKGGAILLHNNGASSGTSDDVGTPSNGAKGGAILLHNNGDSGETLGDARGTSNGVGTPDSSNGTSHETAVIIDEGSISPPGSREPSKNELDAFFKYLSDQELLSRCVHSLM